MKPQDLAIALALTRPDPPATYAALGAKVGLSTSEAHGAVRRLRDAGLLDKQRHVHRTTLLDFLRYGLRVVFPVTPTSLTVGVPTGAAMFPEVDELPRPEGAPWVWPCPGGTVRGLCVAPLYPTLPSAVLDDVDLHRLLAIVDLIRAGRAREVAWARRELVRRLGEPGSLSNLSVDPRSPAALRAIFGRRRVAYTIAKWLRERRVPLVRHPLTKPILAEYRDELADFLATTVPGGTFVPASAIQVLGDKGTDSVRNWVFPSIVDAIVGRRVIDELEPSLRRGDDDRAFVARSRTSSLREPGEYDGGLEWRRFVSSVRSAADGMAVVLSTDVREFFATVDHALARQIVAQRSGAHPSIVQLLFRCMEAWLPQAGFLVRGLPVEPHDVSRLVAHAMLKTVDDEFEDGFDLRYRRFMDDTVVFCESTEDARDIRERHRRALAACGLTPNPQKTRILEAEQLVSEFDPRPFEEIDAAAQDPDRLGAIWRAFTIRESKNLAAERRQIKHLYYATARAQSDAGIGAAIGHICDPGLRSAALDYLGSRSLPEAVLGDLQVLFDRDDTSPEGRLEIVDAMSLAMVPSSAPLADWATRRLADPRFDGPIQVKLLLLVFKHGGRPHFDEIDRWMSPAALADPHVRSVTEYVVSAAGSEVPAWIRFGAIGHPDAQWSDRMLDDIRLGRLRHPARVLRCATKWNGGTLTLDPDNLPLLHLIARFAGSAGWARDLARALEPLADSPDRAVVSHIERILAVRDE